MTELKIDPGTVVVDSVNRALELASKCNEATHPGPQGSKPEAAPRPKS